MARDACLPFLRSPGGVHGLALVDSKTLQSDGKDKTRYPIVGGIPILVNYENSVLEQEYVEATAAASTFERPSYTGLTKVLKRLLSPEKGSTRQNMTGFLAELRQHSSEPPRVLVIGGGTVGQGMQPLYDAQDIQVVSFDIYATPLVQFVADGHDIPLPDGYFDGVIVQAVLEHVLQPARVVAEIWRVLKPRGLVYAETPFMQQVHEAAYDFTRFSESGHRYLFRAFERISSGASGGPGLQFMWSVDYLARSVFRSRRAGKVAKAMFFWMQYVDRFVPPAFAVDAASGVFFLGRKSEHEIGPKDIIAHYQGAQKSR